MRAGPLVRRELRDAVRRYWFLVNTGVFAIAGVLLMVFGQPDAMLLGARGHARTLAGLMQLAMIFVPLMALIPAVVAIAAEREEGTLDYLLAQPLTRTEVYFGKWAGICGATALSVLAGFGLMGMVAAWRGVPAAPVSGLLACTLLLVAAFVSLGLALSSRTASGTRATSLGLTLWILLTGLGSLGVMSAFVQWGLPAWLLQAWAIVNPVEAYRMAGILIVDPATTALGPVGGSLLDAVGRRGVIGLAMGSLVTWATIALALGLRLFAATEVGGKARS